MAVIGPGPRSDGCGVRGIVVVIDPPDAVPE